MDDIVAATGLGPVVTADKGFRARRPLIEAMLRGVRGRCPSCGAGHLFKGFLRVRDTCEVCGEELFHQRADDAPPYVSVLLVGHIVVGLILSVEMMVTLPLWLLGVIWLPVASAMSIASIRPIKGALIGLQWANYMHGFGGEDDRFEPDPAAAFR